MRTMKKYPKISEAVRGPNWLRWFVRQFGFVLVPISEIERMEWDGMSYANTRKKHKYGTEDRGYFSGLSDYASKTASRFRERYLSNNPVSRGHSEDGSR